MTFDPSLYGSVVAQLLALDGDGQRLMPLAFQRRSNSEARRLLSETDASSLFEGAPAPEAALSGLWLYFDCFDESHALSQEISTPDGSFWHAIAHRREPDPGNAGYWFRRVGSHPVFPDLLAEASRISPHDFPGSNWDPIKFIELCERARHSPGSELERVALEVQLVEWQLLFDYCARPHA